MTEKSSKSLLIEFCQQQKWKDPQYTCTPYQEGRQPNGFKCTLVVNEQSFSIDKFEKSKKVAEQCVASIACRQLNVTQEAIKVLKAKNIEQPMFDLLCQCLNILRIPGPCVFQKEDTTGESPVYHAAIHMKDKTFTSPSPCATLGEAKEEASIEALKHIGITNPEEGRMLSRCLYIRRRRPYLLAEYFSSPFMHCPSKRAGWASIHFEPIDEMTGKELTKADDEKNIIIINSPDDLTEDEVFDRVIKVEPNIDGKLLSDLDLSVAAVDGPITVIGNENFSISMFVEAGRIMSTKKGSAVELTPGHVIRGLKCSYQLCYPSLSVYVKAESCKEATKPRKSSPVVTSCGAVVLMYDHEANVRDLNILLTRPIAQTAFITRVHNFKCYLNSLTPNTTTTTNTHPAQRRKPSHRFNVNHVLKDVRAWTQKEVQLLSEMTGESMKELLDQSVKYDERWNEIFTRDLTDILKKLKNAAAVELTRRETEGSADVPPEEEWSLPSMPFQHFLQKFGVYTETAVRCALRNVVQNTGMKIKLSELEQVPVVDVPVNQHAVSRYYVWKGIRKVSGDETDPYFERLTDPPAELGEGWTVDSKKWRGPKRQHDNTSSVGANKKTRPEDNGATDTNGTSDVKKEPATDGDDNTISELPEASMSIDEEKAGPKPPFISNNTVRLECRWFPLEEAKSISPILQTIAEETPFKNQVIALQVDANTFWKEKQDKE